MNFTTVISKLDGKYSRDTVETNTGETLSYLNDTNTSITINSTTYNPHRVCLLHKNNTVYLYINTKLKKYHKIAISTIETIT